MGVQYSDIMKDAVVTIRSVFASCNIKLPDDFEKCIYTYLEKQRDGKRAAPPLDYDRFAYNAEEVRKDSIIAEYCDFFGIQKEEKRITDTTTGLN